MLNNASLSLAATSAAWQLPSRRKVAVAWLIITESAMFTIFVVAYLFYLGKSLTGPSPAQVLALSLAGKVRQAHAEHLEMVAWYWHFVDAVWVVVFTVVYVIGR